MRIFSQKIKFQYTFVTFCLGIFLFTPFIIKSLRPGLEIYPAVIFPAGAEKLNLSDEIRSFQSYEFYGFRDSLILIDPSTILEEVPGQYLHSLIKGNFGLEDYYNEFSFPFTKIKIPEKNNLNEIKIGEAKTWIKEKLNKQNLSDSILVIRMIQKDFNIKTKNLESQNLIYEKTFKLN